VSEKRAKRDVSGWVVLDKPYGMTSTQAVGRVRWLYRAKKAGHAGTLDPLATGVLPIALGEATKTVPIVQEGRKTYRFTLAWGSETATDDREGAVIATSEVRPDRVAVEAILPRFTGTIDQVPPAFSAIKVDGERAYDLARAGEAVSLEARPITIDSLMLLGHSPEATELEAVTGKGAYVRALARDIARALGSCGHVSALRRVRVGPFRDPLLLEALESEERDSLLRPVVAGLDGLPEVRLDAGQAAAVRSGNTVLLTGAGAPVALDKAWASHAGAPVALGTVAYGQFKPSRVFR
jgi:tRNA pseudouridine55 synthase